jgi:hypothetical protein
MSSLLEILRVPGEQATERFLDEWHGPAPRARVDSSFTMPDPLRRFHELTLERPGAIVQNNVVPPEELELDGDGKLLFYYENQGVYLNATDPEVVDARVYGRFDENDPWLVEGDPLSRFLTAVVVFEAVLGAPEGASAAWVGPEERARALAPLERLPLAPWRWPDYPTPFYASDDLVAVGGPNVADGDDTYWSLFIGSRSAAPLAYLAPLIEAGRAEWEYYSPWERA